MDRLLAGLLNVLFEQAMRIRIPVGCPSTVSLILSYNYRIHFISPDAYPQFDHESEINSSACVSSFLPCQRKTLLASLLASRGWPPARRNGSSCLLHFPHFLSIDLKIKAITHGTGERSVLARARTPASCHKARYDFPAHIRRRNPFEVPHRHRAATSCCKRDRQV